MRSFLTRLAPRGPTLLALGVLLGLAFPTLAERARPLMPSFERHVDDNPQPHA